MTRRYFFGRTAAGIGTVALASLLDRRELGSTAASAARAADRSRRAGRPHFPATAKRVIYLSMNGAPSQLETFDYKPKLDATCSTTICPTRCGWGSASRR